MESEPQERKPLTQKQRDQVYTELEQRLYWEGRVHPTNYHKSHEQARSHWYAKTLKDPNDEVAKAVFYAHQGLSKGFPVASGIEMAYMGVLYAVEEAIIYGSQGYKGLRKEMLKKEIEGKLAEPAPKGSSRAAHRGNIHRQWQRRVIYQDFLHTMELDT